MLFSLQIFKLKNIIFDKMLPVDGGFRRTLKKEASFSVRQKPVRIIIKIIKPKKNYMKKFQKIFIW